MTQQFSVEEVEKHNDNKSTWIVIHNNVYDVTPFLNEVSRNKLIRYYAFAHSRMICITKQIFI